MDDSGRSDLRRRPLTDGAGSDRVLVLHPDSGSGDHAAVVRSLASEHGFDVRETEAAGDAIEFARDAADAGASLVAAAGGDGTANEVVRGLWDADALDDVALAVVPAGTGNNFAGNVGVDGIEHAFEVIESGRTRRIDVGLANGRPFLNSCVAGLTADASAETESDSKARLGVLAYVVTTLRALSDFDGLRLAVETDGDVERRWHGKALMVLIGNARRFPGTGRRSQAHVEDGLQEVTIVEERPTSELLQNAGIGQLFGDGGSAFTHLETPSVSIEALDGEELTFSLDGEIVTTDELTVETRQRRLRCFVGEAYRPIPGRY